MGARRPGRVLIGCAVCTSWQGALVLAMAHDVGLMAILARILQRTGLLAVDPLERLRFTEPTATRCAR